MNEKIYWFVAAVFREIDDLAAVLDKLRTNNVMAEMLLVLVSRLDDLPTRLGSFASGDITIATIDHASDGWQCPADREASLGSGLRALLGAARSADGRGKWSHAGNGAGQSRLYAQLRQDADDGANILIANVASASEQLSVARILLRQNCERVLTHEIAVPA